MTVEKLLNKAGIKTNSIKTPKGLIIIADNNDGTFTPFNSNIELYKVYAFLGF